MRVLSTQPARSPAVTGLFAAVFAVSCGLTAVVVVLLAGASALVFRGPLDRPDLLGPALVMLAQFLLFVNPGWNLENVFSAFRAGRSLFWIRLVEALVLLAASVARRPDREGRVVARARDLLRRRLSRSSSASGWCAAGWRCARRGPRSAMASPACRRSCASASSSPPGNLAEGISYDVPIWVLGLSLPAAAVGAYSRAWQTANRFYAFGYRINEMLLPTLVERIAKRDHDAFDRTLLDTARYAALALLLVGAAGGGAAEGIMHIFGPGFEAGTDALAVLLVTPALTVVAGIEAQAQFALDRPWASTVSAVIGMVAKVAGVIVLTETNGLTGAAVGFAAGTLLQFGLQSFDVARHLHGPARRWLPLAPGRGDRGRVCRRVRAAAFGVDRALAEPFGLLAGLAAGSLAFVVAYALVAGSAAARSPADRAGAAPASGGAAGRRARARGRVAAPTPCRAAERRQCLGRRGGAAPRDEPRLERVGADAEALLVALVAAQHVEARAALGGRALDRRRQQRDADGVARVGGVERLRVGERARPEAPAVEHRGGPAVDLEGVQPQPSALRGASGEVGVEGAHRGRERAGSPAGGVQVEQRAEVALRLLRRPRSPAR